MAAAGVRTTKGLYFTLTLLCLVCLASSLTDKEELVTKLLIAIENNETFVCKSTTIEKLKDNLQRAQQQLDREKADYESKGHMIEYMNLMEQMVALRKKKNVPDDFPPMEGLLESVNGFMEKTKTYLERKRAEFDAEESDREVGKMKKLVKFLEETQAEL